MSSTDLVSSLRAEVERLRARVQLLEGVARLNAETIRSMQRAAAEATTAEAIRAERTNNGGFRPHR
jgi:hypothetical protein